MKKRVKSILSIIGLLSLIVFGLFYFLNYRVISGSIQKIEFTPTQEYAPLTLDDSLVKPTNIIVVIADGMGFGHMSLAQQSMQTDKRPSVWDAFEARGWHDARNTYGPLTDSGASATALATGSPTYFEMIGMDKDGNTLETLLEKAIDNGYRTGIVTDSYVWDATPAAFITHTESRDNSEDILRQLAASDLDILFGELEDVGEDGNPDYDTTIQILEARFTLLDESLAIPQGGIDSQPLAAIYKEDQIQDLDSKPSLPQLTQIALEQLSGNDQPFVLMVECEELDSSSHRNATSRMIKGIASLQRTLALLQDFANDHGDTLILFTSDHETGGMAALGDYSNYPNMEVIWATKEHSASVVPYFAMGPGAESFYGVKRNWHIGQVLKALVKQL